MNRKEVVVSTLEHMEHLIEVQKILCEVNDGSCEYCPMADISDRRCCIVETVEFLRDSL